MQDDIFGLRNILRKRIVGRAQGGEVGSIRELLESLPAQIRQKVIKEMMHNLANAPQDSARAAHIARVNELDAVSWCHGIDPGIPAVDRSFKGFKARPGHPDLLDVRAVVERWAAGHAPKMLTLSGPPGVGKSHLAIAACRQLFADDAAVIYREEAAMIAELQGQMRGGNVEAVLQEILLVPWLVIDDLGLTALGDWGRGVMDRIINARWENAAVRHTLITTNLVGDEMPARMASRLRDINVARTIVIQASDYRREGRNG